MTTKQKQVCLVDMDGTICDFDKAMQSELAKLMSPVEAERYWNAPSEQPEEWLRARRRLIKSQPGFWRNMEPIGHGFELIGLAQSLDFECHVLSKGPNSTPAAWTEKKEWCNQYVPDFDVHICGAKKHLVYGRILIDDWPSFFLPWLDVRPRGLVVAVAQPWNKGIQHPRVVRYDGSNTDEVFNRMREARDL